MPRLPTPETCAQCGTDIPPGAHACPECGADERTGWREASIYDGLDLPEAKDDETETRGRKNAGRSGLAWYWWLVALVLLLLLVAAITGLR